MGVSGDRQEDFALQRGALEQSAQSAAQSGEPQKAELKVRIILPKAGPSHHLQFLNSASCVYLLPTIHSGHGKLPLFPTLTALTLLAPSSVLDLKQNI